MDNLSEIVQQLKGSQIDFAEKMAKVEDLGSNVSKTVLRDLIQHARELHETSVVLSFVLFNASENDGAQLEMNFVPKNENGSPIQFETQEESPEVNAKAEQAIDDEAEELLNALDVAVENTTVEATAMHSDLKMVEDEIEAVKDIIEEEDPVEGEIETTVLEPTVPVTEDAADDIPSQDEITASLEAEIGSVIASHSFAKPETVDENVEEDDNSLAAKLGKQKIENLNSAIGINDKFLFTNELFDGNTEQFMKTIDLLNSCASFDDAKSQLDQLKEQRAWDADEMPFQRLQKLVFRKYQ